MAMLEHCVREGDRLDMGIDMTTGTGWCFGGPQITDDLANAFAQHETRDLESGQPLEGKFESNLQAIVAYAEDGRYVELTDKVGAEGTISWVVPDGKWQLMTVWAEAHAGKGDAAHCFFNIRVGFFVCASSSTRSNAS